MALEHVGTLLWEWRTAAGWSLGQLAQRAGVSKAALSQWESGLRQPRLPELEATLEALGVTAVQRALAYSRIEAPRALRQLRNPTAPHEIGPLPMAGDLLRAMRLREGWTQEQIATKLGVGQNTVARWERGERLPSPEQLQALCFALGAHEEEFISLTTGDFTNASIEMDLAPAQLDADLDALLFDQHAELVDLRFILLERALWRQAAMQREWARPLLGAAYAKHAHYLGNYRRWDEAEVSAARAIAIQPQTGPPPEYLLRAVIKRAEALVYGGYRQTPERGLQLLKTWLPRSTQPDYTAWMLSDMGEYMALAGQRASAIHISTKAVDLAEFEQTMRQLDHGQVLVAAGSPRLALEQLPGLPEHSGGVFVYEAFIRCEAYLSMGLMDDAAMWLERANAVIEADGLKQERIQAARLARRF
jgi:transcriptional regulator with XRE-family HTH domain